jgi:hypothetical protein
MIHDNLPIWTIPIILLALVLLSIELGYRLGRIGVLSFEKESTVSAISGSILGLLGFILAFTFSIVYTRYETRKQLVREEANAIGTAFQRSDFLADSDRAKSKTLLKEYIDLRLAAAQSRSAQDLQKAISESESVQKELWNLAVINARKDMNSDIGALYVESINELRQIHSNRLAAVIIDRVPTWIWISLYLLLLLGMVSIGYLNAITSKNRTMTSVILAISFSIVFFIILALDRPLSGMFTVSQQLLVNTEEMMGK